MTFISSGMLQDFFKWKLPSFRKVMENSVGIWMWNWSSHSKEQNIFIFDTRLLFTPSRNANVMSSLANFVEYIIKFIVVSVHRRTRRKEFLLTVCHAHSLKEPPCTTTGVTVTLHSQGLNTAPPQRQRFHLKPASGKSVQVVLLPSHWSVFSHLAKVPVFNFQVILLIK